SRSGARPDPYHVLISESMLQQTQVATVIPYYDRFIARFPTVQALAAADAQDVLRLWQGLGYYSRAQNLLAAARMIVNDFAGQVPSDVESLLRLPGVGRYTAGAVASIAFDRRQPILDGNVARVLCRLERIESADVRDRETVARLWDLATELVPKNRPGDFNQAVMDLGATVCTPRNPQCLTCPLQNCCKAFAAGLQDRIPAPRKTRITPLVKRQTLCIERAGKWLIEQRPPRGRWASMWQFVTIAPRVAGELARCSTKLGRINHTLTHRRYQFDVYRCRANGTDIPASEAPRKWVSLTELSEYPLPKPHLRIAKLLAAHKHESPKR
ncbi:MAG: A/G-specific adenine glycosylase, partial [Burkholderiales bacterium]|nr:A/G-specific adenine glycosylase [Phycisphaerae bacterium]